MQLRPVARQPAGLALKPLLNPAKATVPSSASSSSGLRRPLLPRVRRSSPPLRAPCSVRGMGRDEAEREPRQAPARQGEDEEAAAERKPAAAAAPRPRERSMAYQILAGLYVCAYVFFWRTGELITVNAQEALDRLRRYVRDNFFNQKR